MLSKDHSSKDGNAAPVQRHRVNSSVDEQREYFTEDRRREALPREIKRPSPPEEDENNSGE